MKNFANELRKNQTDAERHLWYYLRSRRFQGYKFRRQYFIESYIVDFICLEKKLVIELDGGQHNLNEVIEYDKKRTDFLISKGFEVLRFWNNEVLNQTNDVLNCIYNKLMI